MSLSWPELAEATASWMEAERRSLMQTLEVEPILLTPSEYPGSAPTPQEVAAADALRQEGNRLYADGHFQEAIVKYSEAAMLTPSDYFIYSNRSACFLRLNRPVEALDDADRCVSLSPNFVRGLLRKGDAEHTLERRLDAQASYRRGLALDGANQQLQERLEAFKSENGASLQTTLYNVLFVSPHLQMDHLFHVLEDPELLTAAYVQENASHLDAQFSCLTQTLRVDVGLLLASPVLRDAYDRVTFACGQLLQWAPEMVTRHLKTAPRIVQGLGMALRCGWRIHHGVAKFSANALTVLATSEGAKDELRREAVRLLLGGLNRWLFDPMCEPENPPDDREVCGCTFLCPRLSAATWFERLFEHGTQAWIREECENFPSILQLVMHLCVVVRDERAVPLGLPCLLRLPGVAKRVMESEVIVDLATSYRDAAGRRESRRWLARQRKNGGGNAAGSDPSEASAQGASSSSEMPDSGTVSVGGSCSSTARPSDDGNGDLSMQGALARPPAPMQRLGEWLMASLGYLLVFVDDDALFASHSCSALCRLAGSVPDGIARLTEGVWMGLPVLERLSMLACQHSAALELLEALTRYSLSARIAISSLAATLASAAPNPGPSPPLGEQENGTPAAPAAAAAEVASSEEVVAMDVDEGSPLPEPVCGGLGQDTASMPSTSALAQPSDSAPLLSTAVTANAADSTESAKGASADAADSAANGGAGSAAAAATIQEDSANNTNNTNNANNNNNPEHDALGEPSWVECYHELHDELWIKVDAAPEYCFGRTMPPPHHGIVSLGNFPWAAPQVPVTGSFCPILPEVESFKEAIADVTLPDNIVAVPSVWNNRYNDAIEGPMSYNEVHLDIGTEAWNEGKHGTVVLLLRSSIQKSPATPDWAAAAWMCAEAGARAVVVANDLEDGLGRPAFRMGLFGTASPPIPGFMVAGGDAALLRKLGQAATAADCQIVATLRSLHAEPLSVVPLEDLASLRRRRQAEEEGGPSSAADGSSSSSGSGNGTLLLRQDGELQVGEEEDEEEEREEEEEGGEEEYSEQEMSVVKPPPWPLVLRIPQDVAQAWSLIETVYRASPSRPLKKALDSLAQRMGLPEKRIWLTRRLQRHHRGDTESERYGEPHLAFVECDRNGDQLQQLRGQLLDKTGIASTDVTGDFEVRFREESSVGSAVMREWMDLLARRAFLAPSNCLLKSFDGGVAFLPDPAAPFLNPGWKGDFELLGRLLGLALWHQVTLDLPIHPYICELLLSGGVVDRDEQDLDGDKAKLESVEPELVKHKVHWLLEHNISELGFDMAFLDELLGPPSSQSAVASSGSCSSTSSSYSSPLPGGGSGEGKPIDPEVLAQAKAAVDALGPVPDIVNPEDVLPGTRCVAEPLLLRDRSKNGVQVQLVPGGESLEVTDENKDSFVRQLLEWRLRGSLRGPIEAMLKGLHAVVPPIVLYEASWMLSPTEVNGLLAGVRDIDVEDWHKNSRMVSGLTAETQEVQWFWKILRQWAADGHQDRLQDLLQFATGSRRVPVGGFAQLVGFNGGKHLFTLAKASHLTSASLPTSHACICTLDLPPWTSFEAASQKLSSAVAAGRSHFDEGTG